MTLSAAALAAVLATGTVKAAPAGLAVSVGTSALAGAATGGGALTLLKLMAMTKLKAGIAGAIIAAGIATTIVVQQKAQAKIGQDEATLQQQSAQLAQLRAEITPPLVASAPSGNLNTPQELARLRDEAAALRLQTNDLAMLREANRQRLAARPSTSGDSPLRTQAERMARVSFAKQAMLAFILFSQQHQDQLPTSIADAAAFLPENLRAKTDDFEVLYQGTLGDVTNPANTIVLRGTDSWQNNGKWARIYAFADGHVEIANTPNNDFSDWESRHIIVNPVK